MQKCEACGNIYDKTIQVTAYGRTHTFDCFECAIHTLAPKCSHCGLRIVGHGMESEGKIFCCAHCARQEGCGGITDRTDKIGFRLV